MINNTKRDTRLKGLGGFVWPQKGSKACRRGWGHCVNFWVGGWVGGKGLLFHCVGRDVGV